MFWLELNHLQKTHCKTMQQIPLCLLKSCTAGGTILNLIFVLNEALFSRGTISEVFTSEEPFPLIILLYSEEMSNLRPEN